MQIFKYVKRQREEKREKESEGVRIATIPIACLSLPLVDHKAQTAEQSTAHSTNTSNSCLPVGLPACLFASLSLHQSVRPSLFVCEN